MKKINVIRLFASVLLVLLVGACSSQNTAPQEMRSELELDARRALNSLYESTPSAEILGAKAKGVLVFPSITKGGFVVGGQYGEGVLFKNGRLAGFYKSVAGSYGLQAGIQKFGYAMFFMEEKDLRYLDNSDGWEIGVGPSITVVDMGVAKSLTTTTLRQGVYAFFFDQSGLMAGLGIQGSKISRFTPGA